MEIQYQIMELDKNHLKKADNMFNGTVDRVCFRPAKLDNLESNVQDSMEDALKVIERSGNDFTEYTIIPRIYMTSY